MPDAYIVDAVRTPIGTRKGALAGVHPADLGAHVLKELMRRTGIDPAAVEDVVMGLVNALGPQASTLAHTAWLSAGLPESVPGTTVNRACGSSQQALHFAAQGIMSGTQDLVVAAGVENMAMVPIDANAAVSKTLGAAPLDGDGWRERYGEQEISQFRGAQLICEKWGLRRAELEAYALQSHRRTIAATDSGRFAAQITPVNQVSADEGARRDTSLEKMAGLAPLRDGWELTAATASQISDGAAALMIASQDAVDRHGLTPRARIHALAVTGSDPVFMLTAPIPATEMALARGKLGIADIDVFEVNEAFAPVLIAWSADTRAPLEKTNPNGGAIALGHPLGATGAILMTKLLHELERTGGRYGLQTMCEGGGQANATIIERL